MNKDILKYCKLYKGEDHNPYDSNNGIDGYFRFQIWDAERSVCTGYDWWEETWKRHNPTANDLSDDDRLEEIYKLAIFDKLRKMEREDIDFRQMYFDL